MQRTMLRGRQELVVLEQEETFKIPANCWAFVELPDGRRQLLQEQSVSGMKVPRLILAPRVAGG
jgi:hypothetical protein